MLKALSLLFGHRSHANFTDTILIASLGWANCAEAGRIDNGAPGYRLQYGIRTKGTMRHLF